MSLSAYPPLKLKLTPPQALRLKLLMPPALKLQFLPAVPGTNAAASADRAEQAAQDAQDAANTAVAATANKVDRTGDVMTGFLTLNADPTVNLQAATKHYVDSQISAIPIDDDGIVPQLPVLGGLLAGFTDTSGHTLREVKVGATMTIDVTGTLNTTAGGGNVMSVGIPVSGQYAKWTSAVQIQGVSAATVLSDIGAQPLDGDLTALAALLGMNTIYYRSGTSVWSPVTFSGLTFVGGVLTSTGGAPAGAEYITSVADATLTAERVLTDSATITWDRTVAGQIKASTAAGGNVSNSGTPTSGQYAKWVTATTIQGVAVATVLTDIGAQPLDADLTSLAGASGTNTIYYRSAANTWSPVTVSTGLAFSGGNLTATATGGGSSFTASSTAPVAPNAGDHWYDLSTGVLSIFVNDGNSSQWVMVSPAGVDLSMVVHTDVAQSLTAAQQTQGRTNIYAAPLDALAYSGMQINGSMEVSQENGSTARTTNGYVVDGWQVLCSGSMVLSTAQVADAPPGYSNSLKISVTTAEPSLGATHFALFMTSLEGYRTSRLAFGTANAQSVSIGFWTKIHRAGMYSGCLRNTNINRTYPFTFTQNVADTWEYKTVTIPGCTDGAWAGNVNTVSMSFLFSMATTYVGTANVWGTTDTHGATGTINGVAATSDTFQITGVVILPGTEAPSAARAPLIMRSYDQELTLCKRYWQRTYASARFTSSTGVVSFDSSVFFGTEMRIAPVPTVGVGTVANMLSSYPQVGNATTVTARFMIASAANGDCYSLMTPITLDARL